MIRGSCLCGAVQFEVNHFTGPFELCHCSRCRKATGSAFAALIGVRVADFSWVSGRDEITHFKSPVIETPPGFPSAFCRHCGSPMPFIREGDDWFEIPAGILDDDPELRPDRHIFVDRCSAWNEISDDLPQLTKRDVIRMRIAEWKSRASASDHEQEGTQ